MSHVNAGDPRAHTNAAEKGRHAGALVDLARKLVLEDQPSGVVPCNECVGATLMLALGTLAHEIISEGKFTDEKLGLARRFKDLEGLCRVTGQNLLIAGLTSDDYLEELVAA